MSESISEGMTVDQTLQESCKDALRHMSVEVTALINKTNVLEAENDKRGELISDMMRFFEDDDACEHCGHELECWNQNGLVDAYEDDCLMRNVFKDRMHELGIEVADE